MNDPTQNEESIFVAAIELATPEQRVAYIDEACGGDKLLQARVMRLLAAHDASQGPLDDPPPGVNSGVTAEQPISEKPGMRIGPYKLLQQIGEGGFGAVFMAEQSTPIRRKVALKIIKPGMDTKQVISRFEAERQALALMDHPNIAKVLDAGSTESGRPYFVMELVRGIPITDYCDRNNLSPRERMELFASACRALQHAHQKGIVHRDVKPANVLVTLHDGTPMVKVIDFGVSKALDKPLTERTLFTEFGQMIGTPLYMSPEQADLSYLDVDSRADVYALGVLLYELLTGATPFDRERLHQAAFDEIRRIIREEDPPVPSKKISTLGETLSSVSAHRSMEPKRLSALLRGDLDWIVMKALEKDRTRRYGTAEDFAADVERHLRDEAVEARPPSLTYRARKFARRNRALLIPAGLTSAMLLVGILVGVVVVDKLPQLRGPSAAVNSGQKPGPNGPPANLTFNSTISGFVCSFRGPNFEKSIEKGRFEANVPSGRYEFLANDRLVDTVDVPDRGRKSIAIYHPNHLSPPEEPEAELFGHTANVNDVAYSADGRTLITSSSDKTTRFWRRVGTKWGEVAQLKESVQGMAVLSDRDEVAMAMEGWNEPLQIRDATTGKLLRSWKVSPQCVAYSRGSNLLACGFHDGNIELWDVTKGKMTTRAGKHDSNVTSIAFSPNGDLVASGSDTLQGTIKLWNVTSQRESLSFAGQASDIHSVTFSPDGTMLASTSSDQMVRVWDVDTGEQLEAFPTDQKPPQAAWISNTLLAISHGRDVKLWNLQTGDPCNQFKSDWNAILSMALSPDGQALATAGENCTVRIWPTSQVLAANKATVRLDMEYAHDLKVVLTGSDGHRKSFTENRGQSARIPEGRCRIEIYHKPSNELLRSGSMLLAAGHTRNIAPSTTRGFHSYEPVVPLQTLVCSSGVMDVRYSRDGSTLATAVWGAGVKIWKRTDSTWEYERTLRSEGKSWNAVAFSPDGLTLATAGAEADVELWDRKTGQRRMTLPRMGHGATNRIAFSPDGSTLATAHNTGRVVFWNWRARQQVASFNASSLPLMAIAFSPDGSLLAVAGEEATTSIWNVERKERVCVLRGHSYTVDGLAFSPDRQMLASSSRDGTTRVWNTETGKAIRVLQNCMGSGAVVFHPSGTKLFTTDWSGKVRLWDINSGSILKDVEAGWRWCMALDISPDGKTLVAGSGDNAVRCWSIAELEKIAAPASVIPDPSSAFFLTGRCAAFADPDNTIAIGTVFGKLSLWNLSRLGKPVEVDIHTEDPLFAQPPLGLLSVVFHPGGRRLATSSRDKRVRLWNWDAESQQCNLLSTIDTDRPDSPLALSAGEPILAVGRTGGVVQLWSFSGCKLLHDLKTPDGDIVSLAFSPNGKRIAAGTDQGHVVVWDVETGTEEMGLRHGSHRIFAIAFHPDGRKLVSGGDDSNVLIWDLAARQTTHTLPGHQGIVYSAAFSPDGKLLVTAGGDADVTDPHRKPCEAGATKLWDVGSGKLLGDFDGHRATVVQAYFLPDSTTLVTMGEQMKTFVWKVEDLLNWFQTLRKEN